MQITLRLATKEDAPRLNEALRALSHTMGDTHRAEDEALFNAAFGPTPACFGLLAEGLGQVIGVALYSPLFSTTRGMAGAYISDLWVDDAARGKGVGAVLLAGVRDTAAGQWGAGFLRLAVYENNPRALTFYKRLGFSPAAGETTLTIQGAALAAIGDIR